MAEQAPPPLCLPMIFAPAIGESMPGKVIRESAFAFYYLVKKSLEAKRWLLHKVLVVPCIDVIT